MHKYLPLSSRSARARRRKHARTGIHPECLEQRLALDATSSRAPLEPARTLMMDPSMGPSTVVMTMQEVAGNDVKSFVIASIPAGSVVEKWNPTTSAWIDVSTMPTSANPRALMQFLENRTIHQQDKLQWRPKAGFAGRPQQAFQMINWDDSSNLIPPNPAAVPSAVRNLTARTTGVSEITLSWDPPTSGNATSYSILFNSVTYVTKETTYKFSGLTSPLAYDFTVSASNAAGTGPATQQPLTIGRPKATTITYLQPLGSDPVVYSAVTGTTLPAAASQPTSTETIWGQSLIFPQIDYQTLSTSQNVSQPTLTLPGVEPNLNTGYTFSTWFQARGPGVLLNIPLKESSTSATYNNPIVYITEAGFLMAGLYDDTPLQLMPGETILTSSPAVGPATNTQTLAAAYPVSSPLPVIDGTWHHVAITASTSSLSLYLDGMLAGTTIPQYHQVESNLTPPTGQTQNEITFSLKTQPTANQVVTGSIWQENVDTQNNDNLTQLGTYSFNINDEGTAGQVFYFPSNANSGFTENPATVNNIQYNETKNSITVTFNNANEITTATSITIYANYQDNESVFSIAPLNSTWYNTQSQPLTFTHELPQVGGTIYPEPSGSPTPTVNYPQGFIGAMDEIAVWSTELIQSEIQMAMSAPINTQPSLYGNLFEYFDFDGSSSGGIFQNIAPNQTDVATPNGGILPSAVASTIPTNPFGDLPRLPGHQNWGLMLMTPFSTSNVALTPNTPISYTVSLTAADSLKLAIPASPQGTLTATIEDTDGNTYTATVSPNAPQYFTTAKTAAFKLSFTWQPEFGSTFTTLTCTDIPGALNSLTALTGTFTTQTLDGPTIAYAYADPTLPTLLSASQLDQNAGPANYWPLWTDTTYFPLSSSYAPSDLALAYQNIITQSVLNGGPSDFCNLNGQLVTNPSALLTYLNEAYENAFGETPPTPLLNKPFPSNPATSPEAAVYEFLYNANLLQENAYNFYLGEGGSTSASYTAYLANILTAITQNDSATTVATLISEGQTEQDTATVTIETNTPGTRVDQGTLFTMAILNMGVAFATDGAINGALLKGTAGWITSAVGSVGAATDVFWTQAAASINSTNATTYNVDISQITNSTINYDNLTTIANSVNSYALQAWTSLKTSISDSFLQKVMSNFGLLQAIENINAEALPDYTNEAITANNEVTAQVAWSQMIPATFKWQPYQPTFGGFPGNYPTADGYSTTYIDERFISPYAGYANLPLTLPVTNIGTTALGTYDVATGDFNNDGNQDFVCTNYASNTFSVGLGDGTGNFLFKIDGNPLSFNLPWQNDIQTTNPQGAEVADFNQDGNADILITVHGINSGALIYWGNGTGTEWATPSQIIWGGGPSGATIADFNHDSYPDFAVANNDNNSVTLCLYDSSTASFSKQNLFLPTDTKNSNPVRLASIDYKGYTLLGIAASSWSYVITLDNNLTVLQTLIYETKGNNYGIAFGNFNNSGSGTDDIPDVAFTGWNGSNGIFVAYGSDTGSGTDQGPWNWKLPPTFNQFYVGTAPSDEIQGLTSFTVPGRASSFLALADFGNSVTYLNQFYAVNMQGATGMNEVAVADFNNDGVPELISANNGSANVSVIYLNPDNTSNTYGSSFYDVGPVETDTAHTISNNLSASQIQQLMWMLQALQGGNAAFTLTKLSSSTNPISSWQIRFPYAFFSINGAQIDYAVPARFGSYLTAWYLYDSNNNPIAINTAEKLFGDLGYGVELTPVDAESPLENVSGAWFMPTRRLSGAVTTWAEAFFSWGQSTSGYGGNPVPSEMAFVTNWGDTETLDFFPLDDLPPTLTSATGYYTQLSTGLQGYIPSNGGLDLNGNAYDASSLLGLTTLPIDITGIPGQPNILRCYGQTVPFATRNASYTSLNLIGTAVNEVLEDQVFVLNFSDGSSVPIVQSFSSWEESKAFLRELSYSAAYLSSDGTVGSGSRYVYSYAFSLPEWKVPVSITLPNQPNLVFLAVGLT